MVREAPSRPPPCDAHRVLLLFLAVCGSGSSPRSARQDGGRERRRSRRHAAGQETAQLRHSHRWPLAMSVVLMAHVWFHMAEKQPAVQAKQTPQHRTLLLDPSGSSGRLRVLCAALSRAHCVLWGFPLCFHAGPSQHNAAVHHFFPNKWGLNPRTEYSPPASQAKGAPLCQQRL